MSYLVCCLRSVPYSLFFLLFCSWLFFFFFFFQAEDGIRDWSVTGVQTCALPISRRSFPVVLIADPSWKLRRGNEYTVIIHKLHIVQPVLLSRADCVSHIKRSEERRVGKECRSRW